MHADRRAVQYLVTGMVMLLNSYLAGCALFSAARMDDEFGEYVKDVFYRQNRAHGQLLLLMLDNGDDRIVRAEQRILEACKRLNKLASSGILQKKPGFIARYRAGNSVGKCDRITTEIEQFLRERKADVLSGYR